MLTRIALATAVAGTLDILGAMLLAALSGTGPVQVLQSVASGPLGKSAMSSPAYALHGLFVHFTIMLAMVTAYMIAATRLELLRKRPLLGGVAYGVGLWLFMYWVVLPIRWPSLFPPADSGQIAGQLFCHIALVGIPIALIAARGERLVQPDLNSHAA